MLYGKNISYGWIKEAEMQGYCLACRKKVELVETSETNVANGDLITVAKCMTCKVRVIRVGKQTQ